MEKTLAIIKPDAVKGGLIGEIILRINAIGLDIVAMEMMHLTKDHAAILYSVHKGQDYFENQINFMSSGPCVVMVLEGEEAITRWRKEMGRTNAMIADPGTIRGDFRDPDSVLPRNLVHGSDSLESAKQEIICFWPNLVLSFLHRQLLCQLLIDRQPVLIR